MFFKELYDKFFETDVMSSAAQVAFYFSFAFFPLLLFLVTLFGLVLESTDELRAELYALSCPDHAERARISSFGRRWTR